MNGVGTCRLVWPDTADLAAVRGITDTSFCEGWTVDVDWVVPTWKNEVTDELLIPVDDEVAAERGGFFAVLDELGGGQVEQVTADGLRSAQLYSH